MDEIYIYFALFLLFTLVLGIKRVLKGPTKADRMLSIQLFGTTIVGILLLMYQQHGLVALIDLALIFALLSAVTAIAFVFYAQNRGLKEDDTN